MQTIPVLEVSISVVIVVVSNSIKKRFQIQPKSHFYKNKFFYFNRVPRGMPPEFNLRYSLSGGRPGNLFSLLDEQRSFTIACLINDNSTCT